MTSQLAATNEKPARYEERKLKKVLLEQIKEMKDEPLFDTSQLTPEAILLLQKIKEEPEENSDEEIDENMVVNLNPDEMCVDENQENKSGLLNDSENVDNKDDIKKEILNEEDGYLNSETNNHEKKKGVKKESLKNIKLIIKKKKKSKKSIACVIKDENIDAINVDNAEATIKKEVIKEEDDSKISENHTHVLDKVENGKNDD